MPIHRQRFAHHRLSNLLQTVLLLAGMGGLLLLVGWLFWGRSGLLVACGLAAAVLLFGPPASAAWVLRLYRATPLEGPGTGELRRLVEALAERAELPVTPRLYYVPSRLRNAFAVGSLHRPVLAVTDGLLRSLERRELAGVLAHEIGHIRNRDLNVMRLADFVSRATSHVSLFGQLLLLLNLPLVMSGQIALPWIPLFLLMAAPVVSSLLQLALSRTREFEADLEAVRLTGDAAGLASALAKMEYGDVGWWQRVLLPGRRSPMPSYLRTHPETAERIRRLGSLVERRAPVPPLASLHAEPRLVIEQPRVRNEPRWRWSGIWY